MKRHYINKPALPFAFLILFLFLCQIVTAQRYPFYELNVENGLVQSQPRDMIQDKAGHLWIATLGGLSRYDGESFVNYTVRDGLNSNNLSTIAADKQGNIWIGSVTGLTKFNGRQFTHYTVQPDTPAANMVSHIKVTDNNELLFLSSGKLYRMVNNKPQRYAVPDGNSVLTTIMTEKNGLWLAKVGGTIFRKSGSRIDSFQVPANPNVSNITVVYEMLKDSKQRYWFVANTGLYTLDSGRIVLAKTRNQRMDLLPALLSITEDRNGALWIGTYSGVMRIADSMVQFFNKRSGLSDNPFLSMLTDVEGNVWMASDGQGVFRYSGVQFTVIDESTGLPSAQVMSIGTDGGGRVFLGTFDAGLFVYEGGVVTPISLPLTTPPSITALRYRNGSLWLGTRGAGLWRWNGKYFFSYMAQSGKLPSNYITALYTDRSNRLWVGCVNGLTVVDKDTFKKIPVGQVSVMNFLQLGGDSMLLATSEGLRLYVDGQILKFITNTELDKAEPQCFTLKGDELWTGTSDNGVIVYNLRTGKTFVINRSNGLQSDFIYNIIEDDNGNIWTGTGYGIHRISMSTDGKPSVYFFGKGHGMKGMESNHNAVLKMKDGSIWFGTTNGALHYKPGSKIVDPQPTGIVMRSVKLVGEQSMNSSWYDSTDVWYQVPYDLRLPYQKNNITFSFHAISLANNEQIRYRYRIEGLVETWSEWSATNVVTFSALPPGKYTFHIQSMALGSSQPPKDLLYPFEIITPFHKTTWFRLLILGACILLGVSIQYLANSRKQRRLKLLEQLRREEQSKVRQRTAEDFHDEVGNRLTRINVLTNVLRSKMPLSTPETDRILEKIQENAAQLYSGTRDILWSLKPSNDNLYEVIHRIRDFGGELFQDTNIHFTFFGSDEKWRDYRLPMDVSRNLIMIFKEALNNTLKYSGATEVRLEAYLRPDRALQIILTDNGVGFDPQYVKKGHGIDNMNVRASRIHGRLYIDSRKDKGTILNLTFRLPKDHYKLKKAELMGKEQEQEQEQ